MFCMEPKGEKDLITVQEAAREASVTEDAIRKAIRRERLPATEMYGRLLVDRSDLLAYKKTAKAGRPPKNQG